MKKPIHQIKKQQLVLDFSTEEKANKWHKSASTFYYEKVLPMLNTVLDKHFTEGDFYFIDNLEIDLGTIEEEGLKEAFLKKTETELTRLLKNLPIQKNPESPYGENTSETQIIFKETKEHLIECFYYFLDHGALPWNSSFTSVAEIEEALNKEVALEKFTEYPEFRHRFKKEAIRRRLYFQFSASFWEMVCKQLYEKELVLLDALQKEIKSILLPFAMSTHSKRQLKQELSKNIMDWIGISAPTDTIDWSKKYILWVLEKSVPYLNPLKENSILSSFKELTIEYKIQFNSSELNSILKTDFDSSDINHKNKTIKQQEPNEDTSSQIEPISADESGSVLSEKVSEKDSTPNQEEITGTEKPFLHKTKESYDDIIQNDQKDKESITHRDQYQEKELKGKEYSNQEETPESHSSKSKEIGDPFYPSEKAHSSEISGKNIDKENSKFDEKNMEGMETNDQKEVIWEKPQNDSIDDTFNNDESIPKEYYIQHAGLILSWPYLGRMFKQLDYLDGNMFKNERQKQRAVHLLPFIASGQEQREEHELVLAKFLCGWPLQMPIIKTLKLTDEEKNEATKMLQNLIVNWTILKNTSIDGLRESFFDRDGKLFKEDGQWRLIIEQKSYDMLLDHLPYTISIIKLPWMKEILKVDWA